MDIAGFITVVSVFTRSLAVCYQIDSYEFVPMTSADTDMSFGVSRQYAIFWWCDVISCMNGYVIDVAPFAQRIDLSGLFLCQSVFDTVTFYIAVVFSAFHSALWFLRRFVHFSHLACVCVCVDQSL